ncbi:transposable element Tcb2 transposase [Trichonephila clavipes]|nr:transposable element Tcb2 transposase [Trichonephila clavipes]
MKPALTTVSLNSNPIIVMLQAKGGFVSKHNVIPFRCVCLPFIAPLAVQTPEFDHGNYTIPGRDEVDMPLRRFRRQYEQLSQFERRRIIGMMEAGWSGRRIDRQLGRSDCVVRRC